MPFDLTQPKKLPLSFGEHVILNLDNGDTFVVKEHYAALAMMKFFTLEESEGWGKFFDLSHPEGLTRRHEQIAFLDKMSACRRNRTRPEFENDLIKVGPFVTWDACLHEKDEEVAVQAFLRFVELGGDLVRPLDQKIAAHMSSQQEDHEPELTVESNDPNKHIHTVKEVTGRNRSRGCMPPELEKMFGGMGIKFREVSPGVMMGSMDLDDFLGGLGKGDDKDEKKD